MRAAIQKLVNVVDCRIIFCSDTELKISYPRDKNPKTIKEILKANFTALDIAWYAIEIDKIDHTIYFDFENPEETL